MESESINKLFESAAKVRVLKLFLQNPDHPFNLEEVVKRAKVSKDQCRRLIRSLHAYGILKITHAPNSKKITQETS